MAPISTIYLKPAAAQVFEIMEPAVLAAASNGVLSRPGLAMSFGYCNGQSYVPVLEQIAGDPGEGRFMQTAQRKQQITARFRLPAHAVLALYPELLLPDVDEVTQWGGNAYCDMTELAVAGSGASGRVDQGFAEACLSLWKALLGDEVSHLIITARALKLPSIGAARGRQVVEKTA